MQEPSRMPSMPPRQLSDMMTVRDARKRLLAEFRSEGEARCHECGHHLRLQRRTLTRHLAEVMILMYQRRRRGWVYVPGLPGQRATDFSVVRYWGLVEQRSYRDGAVRRGWFRLTADGIAWLDGEITVPKFIYTHDSACLRKDGPPWRVADALGKNFNYDDFMAGLGG